MSRLNQKGQGATEYVVILAIVVGIAIFIFTGPLKTALNSKVSSIASDIQSANGGGGGGNP